MSDLAEKNLRIHSGFAITPAGWTETTVSQICDLGRGRVISQDEINSKPGPFPVFSSQTRNNGEMGRIDTFDFSGEYVTWTTDGENAGTVFFRSGQFNCTNVCGTLRTKASADLDLDFLTYHLGRVAKRYVSYIGNPKLMNGVMASIGLVLPPGPQQRRIATILTTMDEVIEATEKLVEKHQQIKAGLMYDLFTRGLWTSPELARGDHKGLPSEASAKEGQLRPTPEEAPGLYQDSPIGLIPKAWKPGLLSDYLDPINGIKPGPFGSSLTKDIFTTSGFRVYGQEQVISGNLEIGDYYISPHKFAEMRTFEILEGDVLLSLVGTVGCVLIVEAPFEPGIINPRLLGLRPLLEKASPHFVRYLLLTDGLRKQIDSLAGGGTMPVINGKIIRRLRIPMISPEEQKLIVTRLESLEHSVTSTTTHLAKLHQQKQGLMHDLLTGRVRVNELKS